MKIHFIQLHEEKSGKSHRVNMLHLQDFADNEVWIDWRKFKIQESEAEIIEVIESIFS